MHVTIKGDFGSYLCTSYCAGIS